MCKEHDLNKRPKSVEKKPNDFRTDFARDRDAIIHSSAFRRLHDKTQVFFLSGKSNVRTRLAHTLEVFQIAKTIVHKLHLQEDLVEAIALGHDLGHAPFGHTGEEALSALASTFALVDIYLERYEDYRPLTIFSDIKNHISQHLAKEGLEFPNTENDEASQTAVYLVYLQHIKHQDKKSYEKHFRFQEMIQFLQKYFQGNLENLTKADLSPEELQLTFQDIQEKLEWIQRFLTQKETLHQRAQMFTSLDISFHPDYKEKSQLDMRNSIPIIAKYFISIEEFRKLRKERDHIANRSVSIQEDSTQSNREKVPYWDVFEEMKKVLIASTPEPKSSRKKLVQMMSYQEFMGDKGFSAFSCMEEKDIQDSKKYQWTSFRHNIQSLRVVDFLEKKGEGLNLTLGVRDGIIAHSKMGKKTSSSQGVYDPMTPEGKVVKLVDRVAYVQHDIQDAMMMQIDRMDALVQQIHQDLGIKYEELIHHFVVDICQFSENNHTIGMQQKNHEILDNIYQQYLFPKVYRLRALSEVQQMIQENYFELASVFYAEFYAWEMELEKRNPGQCVSIELEQQIESKYPEWEFLHGVLSYKQKIIDYLASLTDSDFARKYTQYTQKHFHAIDKIQDYEREFSINTNQNPLSDERGS